MDVSYSDHPPQIWPELLKNAKTNGYNLIRTRVPWGLHESRRGEKDFIKSRLRLEKFLSLAQAESMRVVLELGFSNGNKTFPDWTYELPLKALVPASAWFNRHLGLRLVEIPSIGNPEIQIGFGKFIEEFFTRFHFYQFPDGPVEQVVLNMDLFRNDLNAKQIPGFLGLWEKRYESIRTFNEHYLTHFKDFKTLSSPQTNALLFERRAWLYAYDYKFCRNQILNELVGQWVSSSQAQLWQGKVVGKNASPLKSLEAVHLADSTLLEITPIGEVFPFLEAGQLRKGALSSFQSVQSLLHLASKKQITLQWLENSCPPLDAPLLVVFCGKYLSKKAALDLNELSQRGTKIFFPIGFPQYDENMQSLSFSGLRMKVLQSGRVFSDPDFFPSLANATQSILGGLNEYSLFH